MKRLICAVTALSLVSCSSSSTILGRDPRLLVYLHLTVGVDTVRVDQLVVDSSLYALVAVSDGAPFVRYVEPSVFAMLRRRDRAVFGWRHSARDGVGVIGDRDLPMRDLGNMELPWATSNAGLGRSALTPGDTYDLTIEAAGIVATGSAVLPAAPIAVVQDNGGIRSVHWSRSRDADGFEIQAETDSPGYFFLSDTSYVLREDNPNPVITPMVRIAALDAHSWRYLRDSTVIQAGLAGAIGLFGASARTSVRAH